MHDDRRLTINGANMEQRLGAVFRVRAGKLRLSRRRSLPGTSLAAETKNADKSAGAAD